MVHMNVYNSVCHMSAHRCVHTLHYIAICYVTLGYIAFHRITQHGHIWLHRPTKAWIYPHLRAFTVHLNTFIYIYIHISTYMPTYCILHILSYPLYKQPGQLLLYASWLLSVKNPFPPRTYMKPAAVGWSYFSVLSLHLSHKMDLEMWSTSEHVKA